MRDLADTASLRAFVAVADAKSFSEGARRAGLTRSAASKAVARLEELLGARLLHRTTRQVGLTADGHLFHEQASRVLADLEDAQTLVRQNSRPRGTLRVTAPEAFGRQIILPLLKTYLERWPELSAEANFTDRSLDLVEEGFDLSVRFGAFTTSSDLVTRVVAHADGQLCASPDYLAKHGDCTEIDDLGRHMQLLSGTRDRPRDWVLRIPDGSPVKVPPRPTLLCDNAGALREAALAGFGVACLPRFLIQADVTAGRLSLVLPDHATPQFPISVVYPSRRQLPRRVRLFIDMIVETMAVENPAIP